MSCFPEGYYIVWIYDRDRGRWFCTAVTEEEAAELNQNGGSPAHLTGEET